MRLGSEGVATVLGCYETGEIVWLFGPSSTGASDRTTAKREALVMAMRKVIETPIIPSPDCYSVIIGDFEDATSNEVEAARTRAIEDIEYDDLCVEQRAKGQS